jgi:ParB-like chromosome segregation protein Spo0J
MVVEIAEQAMEFHEVAKLFPLIQGEEFDDLVKDIKENGLKQPIWIYQGKIVDGRNRYKACLEAGVRPRYQEWDGDGSLVSFTISLNVKRRHLTKSQLAIIAPQVEEQFTLEAAKNMAIGGAKHHGNQYTGIETEGLPNLVNLPIHAAEETAKVLDVSKGYVIDAKKIQREAPELIEHVKDGTLTIPDAKAIAALPKERRSTVVKKTVKRKEEEGKRVSKAVKDAIIEQEIEEMREKTTRDAELEHKLTTLTLPPEPVRNVQQGQIWKLGKHLLYCGDSTSQDFKDLAAKTKATFAFADPPYNAEVEAWDYGFVWGHDYLLDCAPIVAVTPGIVGAQGFLSKTTMQLSWAMSYWLDNGMTRGALGFGNWIYVTLFAKRSIHRNAQDIWIPNEDRGRVSIVKADNDPLKHKGRKPFGMMRHIVELFTNSGDTVIDPFLGSGTTLIVCADTDRVCVGAEKEVEFCKSILDRWELWTGEEAVLCQ